MEVVIHILQFLKSFSRPSRSQNDKTAATLQSVRPWTCEIKKARRLTYDGQTENNSVSPQIKFTTFWKFNIILSSLKHDRISFINKGENMLFPLRPPDSTPFYEPSRKPGCDGEILFLKFI